jgi:hypothetical protein
MTTKRFISVYPEMKRDLKENEYRFTCPVCKGHDWGTSGGMGCCHGYYVNEEGILGPCKYTWPREKDAELHPRLLEGLAREKIGWFSPITLITEKEPEE